MPSEPYLSEEQQIALFHAVGRRVSSIVTGTRGVRIADQVPDIANIPLLGAFVSLKRTGELRSCMGMMSDEIPLGEAVERSALLAAREDPRFPPIAPAELFELDMEIWILWGMKRVSERGTKRLNAVTIGEHGVQISRGGNRGLLLPGVAVEHEMDAQTFLEAVCRKAGLPTDAWLDDRSLLHIFEGRCIAGPLSATENIDKKTADEMIFAAKFKRLGPRVPGPSLAETEEVRNACFSTFRGMVEGVSPSNFFLGLFDGNVSGVSLMYQLPERPQLICSKISVRPDVRFQGAVVELLRVLGQQVEHFGATPQELFDAKLDLAAFWDPAIHGNANRYDLSAVDSAYRALMISSPKGWIVQYDPNRSIEDILQDSLQYIDLDDKDLGEVISFETSSTAPRFFISSIIRRRTGAEVRPPAVAGAFYPADAEEMNAELDKMLNGVDKSKPKRAVNAVMIPHAGWIYSGELAAQTLSLIEIPETVIIFAPKHRAGGTEWAVAPNAVWQLPGGSVETDIEFAEAMVQAVNFFEFDETAHRREHAVEVQLPLLARLSPKTKIVGITMATTSWEMIQRGANLFAAFLKKRFDEDSNPNKRFPLFLISSDMNHFANEETTRRVDAVALNAIEQAVKEKKPDIALATILGNQISMCGITPATFVMQTLKHLGKLNTVEPVGYTTSAAVSGDIGRVVGYAGLLFT